MHYIFYEIRFDSIFFFFFWIKIYFYKSVSLRFESQIEQQTGEAMGNKEKQTGSWLSACICDITFVFCILLEFFFFLFLFIFFFYRPCFFAWQVWLLITGCQKTSHDGAGSWARRGKGRTFGRVGGSVCACATVLYILFNFSTFMNNFLPLVWQERTLVDDKSV